RACADGQIRTSAHRPDDEAGDLNLLRRGPVVPSRSGFPGLLEVRDRGRTRTAELPRGNDQGRDHADRDQREDDHVSLDPPVLSLPRRGRAPPGPELLLLLRGDEPRVVLVDEELALEPEILRVGAEEA